MKNVTVRNYEHVQYLKITVNDFFCEASLGMLHLRRR